MVIVIISSGRLKLFSGVSSATPLAFRVEGHFGFGHIYLGIRV